MLALARDGLTVKIALRPLRISVRRGERRLMRDGVVRLLEGSVHDHFVQVTEGVLAREEIDDRLEPQSVEVAHSDVHSVTLTARFRDERVARIEISLPGRDRVRVVVVPPEGVLRTELAWAGHPEQRFTGLGARHGTRIDQAGRAVQLGADRRYTGPDCPSEMLAGGGIPQGDYAPVPFVLSSRGWAAWVETYGNGARFELGEEVALSVRAASGPLVVHLYTDPSPVARLRRYLCDTGLPALLPEWAYGHWKSRDVYEHQSDVEDDVDGYAANDLALDAVVIDSPWETTYNSWEVNPYQFPDFAGMVRRFRATGVRTVVWTTPWTNLESVDGQRPPDADSERLNAAPASNYAEGAEAGHFLCAADGSALVARWWMGTGSPVDFTNPAAWAWWQAQAEGVLRLGVEGIKADDGEGYYMPDDVRFADGRTGAQAAWAHGLLYRQCMQDALDAVHPGEGVLFGRPGWSGQQALGMTWGGDQASDFWSLRALVAATLTAAASGLSNWSHDIGGYLGERLIARCPKELLVRWLQFGCFTPLMQAHGRFEQEAWTYDEETLELYRRYVLLHECIVPYVRAAAATAARCGLPIIRPLCLLDPADPRGWSVSDAYGYGPSLWVAPVIEAGVDGREVALPRGRWIDFWTGEAVAGGGTVLAAAPLERIPVFVRDGALLPTYPAEHVAGGLGDTPEAERPLEVTVFGEPHEGTGATLADGTRVRWRSGCVETWPQRRLTVRSRPGGMGSAEA
ncbi:MAG: glycoside hydrolase family 31 protein [Thermoleophilaceae bacterium]|nr:glycoside hydrolase family 31 protein [Thermoleophilaceae bacterium]